MFVSWGKEPIEKKLKAYTGERKQSLSGLTFGELVDQYEDNNNNNKAAPFETGES